MPTDSAKPDGVGVTSQPLIPKGERSGFVDAHRDDEKRFVVRAGETRTAFVELDAAVGAASGLNCSESLGVVHFTPQKCYVQTSQIWEQP